MQGGVTAFFWKGTLHFVWEANKDRKIPAAFGAGALHRRRWTALLGML